MILTKGDIKKIAGNMGKINTGCWWVKMILGSDCNFADSEIEAIVIARLLKGVGNLSADLEGVFPERWGLRVLPENVKCQKDCYEIEMNDLMSSAVKLFLKDRLPFLPELDSVSGYARMSGEKAEALQAKIKKKGGRHEKPK